MDINAFIKSAGTDELLDAKKLLTEELESREGTQKKISKVITYSDGASRGNPGHAGIGILVCDEKDDKILQDSRYIGQCTNNEAEYRALLLALERAYELTHENVACFLDSELLVRQLNGQYAVKSEKMAKFYAEVKNRMEKFSSVTFTHLPRSHPRLQLADKLANKGIDDAKPFPD